MKKTILSIAIIAAAFLAASCQKENLQENIAPEGSASVFTATIESGANTKTTVERIEGTPAKYKTKWESGDQISINGVTYSATPDGTDATKATFTKGSGDDPTGTYKAYFPATMYDGTKATLPASYTYADGKYNMPMYAQSESTNLSFKNLCGVLAITVSNADFASVSSIEVSSDHQMNGEFTATEAGALTFADASLTDDLKKVTLTFTSAKTIAVGGSATFYIPVPAGTHNPLTIKVTNGSTVKTMVTKKSGGVAVARNTVYPINFKEPTTGAAERTGGISVNWVRLWENGPKFAEYNVGAENNKPEDYGGYYCWGIAIDKDSSGSYKDGESALSGDDDTATNLWGENWRMPTKAELEALLSSCDVEWMDGSTKKYNNTTVKGLLCKGKDAYASNSVFLPAAGLCEYGDVTDQGNNGLYWSSTPEGSDSAYLLYFDSSLQFVNCGDRYFGCSVRAVLAEFD